MNKEMKLTGFNSVSKSCSITRDQPFSDMPSSDIHYGMPITAKAFWNMVHRFWDEMNKPHPGPGNVFKDVYWVEFSKASLFRILAQEECDYIRFFLAIPEQDVDEASLALYGLKSDLTPVKFKELDDVATRIGREPNADDETVERRTDLSRAAATEEKGNKGKPLREDGRRNINSMKEFFDSNKDRWHGNIDFAEFVVEFNKHANTL